MNLEGLVDFSEIEEQNTAFLERDTPPVRRLNTQRPCIARVHELHLMKRWTSEKIAFKSWSPP